MRQAPASDIGIQPVTPRGRGYEPWKEVIHTKRSNEDKVKDGSQTSVLGFIGRFAVTHTAVYFIAGMIFAVLMNYRELFAAAEYAFMRPFEHPLVILGPSLQIFRGALLALAFLPFRKVITPLVVSLS